MFNNNKKMQMIESNTTNTSTSRSKYIKRGRNGNNTSVKFNSNFRENLSEREKKLTAKYSNHELMFIKNRLNFESWIDEKLHDLYEIDDNTQSIKLGNLYSDDLVDNLINLDADFERRVYLVKQLETARKSQEIVSLFIDELLIRLRML